MGDGVSYELPLPTALLLNKQLSKFEDEFFIRRGGCNTPEFFFF